VDATPLRLSGCGHSPVVVPSWVDIVEGSPFLTSLLAEPPPRPSRTISISATAAEKGRMGRLSLRSQLSPRAQTERYPRARF